MNCNQIVWHRKSVKITGQDIPTANVGGWTFNVHHKLNIQSSKFAWRKSLRTRFVSFGRVG